MYSPSSPLSPSPNYHENVLKSPSINLNSDNSLSSELPEENLSHTKNLIPKQPRKSLGIYTNDKILSSRATRSFRSPINPLFRSTDNTPRSYNSSFLSDDENERRSSRIVKNKCRISRSPSQTIIRRKNTKLRSDSFNRNKKFDPRKYSKYSRRRQYSSCNSKPNSKAPTLKKRKHPKEIIESSSDYSDFSSCSNCSLEQNEKHKKNEIISRTKRLEPSVKPKLKPSIHSPSLPLISLSKAKQFKIREICEPTSSNSSNIFYETKKIMKFNEDKRRKIKASDDITAAVIHKSRNFDELSSDESDYQPPKCVTLTERFGKMVTWNNRHPRSDHRNIRITTGDNYEIKELDIPLQIQKSYPETPAPRILNGSWDVVRFRYAHYKEKGYLGDLTFDDYIKWEDWWYNYQEFLNKERSTFGSFGSAFHRT